jgi:hypothetical protein
MVTSKDVVYIEISKDDLNKCIDDAKKVVQTMTDRSDLHSRDNLERFINILTGEVAESMVLGWLRSNGKFADSAVDKGSNTPDAGHDIIVMDLKGKVQKCSVKSSLSYKLSVDGILQVCKLATKASELRDINIQVYYWLTLEPSAGRPRITVPSIRQSAIIGWFGKKDIDKFSTYKHEKRQSPDVPLKDARPMGDLLPLLK